MKIKASVVVKKNKKWYIGYIEGYKFHKKSEVKKLTDVKNVTNYVTLAKYLKSKNKKYNIKSLVPLILKKCNVDSIYILDKPINPSDGEFENFWWSDMSEKCKKCEKECKQSSKAKLINCKSFKEINEK